MPVHQLLRAIQSKDFVTARSAFNDTVAEKMRAALSREYQSISTTWLESTSKEQPLTSELYPATSSTLSRIWARMRGKFSSPAAPKPSRRKDLELFVEYEPDGVDAGGLDSIMRYYTDGQTVFERRNYSRPQPWQATDISVEEFGDIVGPNGILLNTGVKVNPKIGPKTFVQSPLAVR